jgi:hypothetical protein
MQICYHCDENWSIQQMFCRFSVQFGCIQGIWPMSTTPWLFVDWWSLLAPFIWYQGWDKNLPILKTVGLILSKVFFILSTGLKDSSAAWAAPCLSLEGLVFKPLTEVAPSRVFLGCWDHEISIIITSISDGPSSVGTKTLFKLFINHGNHDDSFVEVTIHTGMVFGYDLLCDLLEMLES